MLNLKIAIVYDHVNTLYGGAEVVLQSLRLAFPNAVLFTSVYHPKAKWANNWTKKTSFLQSIPGLKFNHRLLAPLMPIAFEQFDFSNYNIIISVSAGAAKGIITTTNQLHLCYLLTPTRYLYSHKKDYFKSRKCLKLPIIKNIYKLIYNYLLWWDQAAAFRPDKIIPISKLIQLRTKKNYKRDSLKPLYPPIDCDKLNQTIETKKLPLTIQKFLTRNPQFFLSVSRLVSYKQIPKTIKACQKNNFPLIIIGDGPQKKILEKYQSDKILLLGNQPRSIVNFLMKKMIALIMPQVEDFGITALEAAYFGKASLISQESGVAEILNDKSLSVAIKEISVKTISVGLNKIMKIQFNSNRLKQIAQTYDKKKFIMQFRELIYKLFDNQV